MLQDWVLLTGGIIGLTGNTVALIIGISRFKRWMEHQVLEPYIRPLRDDVQSIREADSKKDEILREHKKILDEHERYIYLLIGKTLGDVPKLDEGSLSS